MVAARAGDDSSFIGQCKDTNLDYDHVPQSIATMVVIGTNHHDPTYMIQPLRSNQMAGGERQERQYEQRLQEAEQQLRVQAQVLYY